MDNGGRLIVAIDDGYAQTKVVGMAVDGGPPRREMFRTSVRAGRLGLKATSGTGSIGAYRTEEGEEFTVSELIQGEDTKFDGFHTSAMNRVLVNHALVLAGYGGRDVNIVTGLPVGDYFLNDGEINEEKIDLKRRNLLKGVENSSSKSPLAAIKDVEVGCQAISAWVDYMLDDDLKFRRDSKGQVAIVDIGGRTTDIAVIVNNDGEPFIDYAKSGTQNIGVLDVYKSLSGLVKSEFKIADEFPLATLDGAVRSGRMEIFGESQDVAALVSQAIKDVDGRAKREIDRRIGSAATLRAVVFVGGGSALFGDLAKSFRNGVLIDDPEYANARGLLKFERLNRKETASA